MRHGDDGDDVGVAGDDGDDGDGPGDDGDDDDGQCHKRSDIRMSVYGVEQMFPNGGWFSKQDECKCMLEYFSHALHADLFHGTVRQVHYT